MKLSRRLSSLPPYLFVEINRKIALKKANGEEVISFAIGDPDMPTPSSIVSRLCEAAREPENHRYPETAGLPELRQAISAWYNNRFGVKLDSNTEVVPLIGSKEGIGHIAFCLIDPGDLALVPDPAYPVYGIGTILAGGEQYSMPLLENNGFLPDFDSIPDEVLKRARVMWLNYPNNPTGAVCDLEFFKKRSRASSPSLAKTVLDEYVAIRLTTNEIKIQVYFCNQKIKEIDLKTILDQR